ncbi:MAG: squalene synthase HpnC, partial [Streptosporangiaceae bacterium]
PPRARSARRGPGGAGRPVPSAPARPDAGPRPGAGGAQPAGPAMGELAAAENFPVALRLLPARYRRHLMAVYTFARTVDDVGDKAPPADRSRLLDEIEADVRRLYGETAGEPVLPAVGGLRPAVAQCRIEMAPFVDLIQANRQDQQITRYQTFDELLSYCRLSANPVGRIVLRIFGSYTPERAGLSDRVCTALQLAEHWQDVAEDLRAGRIYLPAEDMAAHGCTEADLAAPHAAPHVRALLADEVRRARQLLDSGAPLVGTLRGAARLAVGGYVAGGRAALAAIAAADYDVLAVTPRPGRAATVAGLAAAYTRGR